VTILHRLRHKLYGFPEQGRAGVEAQNEDDARAIGRQLAVTVGILFAYCSHTMVCFQRVKREHKSGSIKGSRVLCLLEYGGQAFVSLSSGGVRRRLQLSARAPRLTPPDYPHAILMAFQI
jgi:hypothetical protein